jgi:uncharacterized protein (TIGR00255 family)
MPLRSMTAFARADGAGGGAVWHWEVRTVNGRGLDLRLRLPAGQEALEGRVRELCAERITRGSVAIGLNLQREAARQQVKLNESVLLEVAEAARRAAALVETAAPRLDGILAIKGVLEVVEPEESAEEAEARQQSMLNSLDQALSEIIRGREQEGARLKIAMESHLRRIEQLVAEAEVNPFRSPERIEQRLAEQVHRLLQAGPGLDPQRLHQEAVLLAVKADIAEELQRLTSHIAAARELLDAEGPVGRKLDFLAQEFNREANTLCSKASDPELTRTGLALKATIDQMREQVQNIE